MLEILKAKLDSAETDFCQDDDCEFKKSVITFELQKPPKIYLMHIIWENNEPRYIDIFLAMCSITDSTTMIEIYGKSSWDPYNIKGIILQGRDHYEYACRYGNEWTFKGLVSGCGWLELIKEVLVMKYHPVCIVY